MCQFSLTQLRAPINPFVRVREAALPQRVIIVGAGMGGLAAAVELAAQGFETLVLERALTPGGKMRELDVGGARIDAGPTVFTMRWVFDELFDAAGADFGARVGLQRVERLARHGWPGGSRLDLFAEIDRNVEAIGDFAGAREAAGYRAFARRARRRSTKSLRDPFIRASRPSLPALMRRVGRSARPHRDLVRSPRCGARSASHFQDPRLRQLFGRYATYCGSSPFQAPATLMLVAHVEREGVWSRRGRDAPARRRALRSGARSAAQIPVRSRRRPPSSTRAAASAAL